MNFEQSTECSSHIFPTFSGVYSIHLTFSSIEKYGEYLRIEIMEIYIVIFYLIGTIHIFALEYEMITI